jgi:30S ribosomal protein S31
MAAGHFSNEVHCAPRKKRAFDADGTMGKGDRKTRRGKIYRGSFGKSRPKKPARLRKAKSAKKR